jgi:hypothetical protein
MRIGRTIAATTAVLALVAAGCGGDGDGDDDAAPSSGGATDPAGGEAGDQAADAGDPAGGSTGGGGGGTLVLAGETIELDDSRCHLEAQDAAAGGGQILFVGQGFGADANGEDVMIDVSRYDEDSMFAGDDVSITVGDITSDGVVSLSSMSPTGTVTVDGATMRGDGITLLSDGDGSEQTASFEIDCG